MLFFILPLVYFVQETYIHTPHISENFSFDFLIFFYTKRRDLNKEFDVLTFFQETRNSSNSEIKTLKERRQTLSWRLH